MMPFHFTSATDGVVVPAHLAGKAELLAYLHRAVPLPDYFGHNWDALEECLLDLEWLDQPKLVLIHQDIPLPDAPADQRLYLEILAAAANQSKRLTVVFPQACRAHVEQILSFS